MLKVTSGAFHEKLSAGEEEIILNGPPGDLRGHISIRNKNNDTLKVKSLPLFHGNQLSKSMGSDASLNLSCRLNPGEEKIVEVWHQLNTATAPGTYENTIMVGGVKRKVKMIVQENIAIDIHPREFNFTGIKPGTAYTAEFTLTNLGNVSFEIPDIKHVAALDLDMLCRAFGMGMRSAGGEGAEKMLDEVTRNINKTLPDWAKAQIKEKGEQLAPGASMLVHLVFTLPKNCDTKTDHSITARFWDQDITCLVKA